MGSTIAEEELKVGGRRLDLVNEQVEARDASGGCEVAVCCTTLTDASNPSGSVVAEGEFRVAFEATKPGAQKACRTRRESELP